MLGDKNKPDHWFEICVEVKTNPLVTRTSENMQSIQWS